MRGWLWSVSERDGRPVPYILDIPNKNASLPSFPSDTQIIIERMAMGIARHSPIPKVGRAEFAYAAVIKINGRDMFFLFIDEE